ncbi:MAG: DNA (cytosine-5-)-methyltransferase [Bacteroidota bacterium]
MNTLNNTLTKIREKMGISQEALARKLDVSFSTINRWENKKSYPRNNMIDKINELAYEVKLPLIIEDKTKKCLTAMSFFSGADGFALGMEQAKFKVIFATDIDKEAENTHKRNWPDIPFLLKDIRQISVEEINSLTNKVKPDLIFGGPPCQGFSTLGDKRSSDPRNHLFDAYIDLIYQLDPKYVLFENVKSFMTMYNGQYANYIVSKFNKIGYKTYIKILNSVDYGVPQHRERVFIFATKSDANFNFPPKTHGEKRIPYETVGHWINDLVDKEKEIPNHIPLNHSDIVIQRYKFIPEGGRLPPPDQLPKEIRRKNFGNTYKRLHRNKPSLTMVPGNNAFPIHPFLDRSLTPREAARLQTFPDDFIFTGDRRSQCILVGNAVPPRLAEAIGKYILKHHNKEITKSRPPAVIKRLNNLSEIEDLIFPQSNVFQKNDKLGFIDLFSGAGGITIGFTRGGFKPLLSVDNNSSVAKTHRKNYPSIPHLEANLADKNVKDEIVSRVKGKNIAIVAGGPPCQGFSIFGKRRFINSGFDPHTDERNKLVFSFIELVGRIQPRWFIMENVAGFTTLNQGDFFKYVIKEYHQLGYYVEAKVLNTADYGAPQLRKRLIIIGNRTNHIIPWPKKKYFLNPKEWQKPFRTVGEVITDLSYKSSYDKFTCHVPMNHKPLLVERYKYIPEGEKLNIDKLPDHLKNGYRTNKVKNYSHVFKRLHREKPSLTMVPGHNAFPIHPWLNRALTVREAARIQTFPDAVEFIGTRQDQCIQVGNAFPPIVAEYIANNILKAEVNNWYPDKVPHSAYYSIIEKDNSDELTKDILNDS